MEFSGLLGFFPCSQRLRGSSVFLSSPLSPLPRSSVPFPTSPAASVPPAGSPPLLPAGVSPGCPAGMVQDQANPPREKPARLQLPSRVPHPTGTAGITGGCVGGYRAPQPCSLALANDTGIAFPRRFWCSPRNSRGVVAASVCLDEVPVS